MNSTEATYTIVPLGQAAHSQASQFAAEQLTPEKGTKVYLNTLAVYAVHQYLKWVRIDTNLTRGDCWHPGKRALFDVADLFLPGVGKLECRPILAGETTITLPFEVAQNRFGYVAVQFSEHLNEAKLLGFVRAVDVPEDCELIALTQFQPIDTLLDYLPEVLPQTVLTNARRINLGQWLQDTFEAGWQSLEALLGTEQTLGFSLRSRLQPSETVVQRAKLIDLGLQLGNQSVILLVAIAPVIRKAVSNVEVEPEVEILVQVHPTPENLHLPLNLQLNLLAEDGEILQEVRSREHDNYIQLRGFQGMSGECFDIQLSLGTNSLKETFVI